MDVSDYPGQIARDKLKILEIKKKIRAKKREIYQLELEIKRQAISEKSIFQEEVDYINDLKESNGIYMLKMKELDSLDDEKEVAKINLSKTRDHFSVAKIKYKNI